MGINGSIEADTPFNEHFFGLVNFGNTCYVNSVLQALYFCKPFREKIIQYKLSYSQRTHALSAKDNQVTTTSSGDNDSTLAYGNQHGSTQHLFSNNEGALNNATLFRSESKAAGGGVPVASANSNASNSAQASSILKQEHLLNCLAELFHSIVTMKKKKGIVQPKKFIARLRKDNESFDNLFQQDAHEFLNYLLNTCADILKAEMKELRELKRIEEQNKLNEMMSRLNTKNHRTLNVKSNLTGSAVNKNSNGVTLTGSNNSSSNSPLRVSSTNGSSRSLNSINSNSQRASNPAGASSNQDESNLPRSSNSSGADENKEELTWIHELFQGILVNETKCLNCETSSSKEENFLDLSVDVEQNTSISHCLQEFSNMEMLCGECKYYCENCSSKQEAEKRMRIKKLPRVLALHLKRFKFVGMLNKFKKLTYRVVFPFELRLFNTTEDCLNSDRIYDLVSFVVHCGIGLNRGHYISVVKSHGYWFLFDDEQVEKIEVSNFEDFYGLTQDTNKKSETSYILFYESRQS